MAYLAGVPAVIADLQQQGLIERAFHDGIMPWLGYRSEAMWEEWPAHQGTEIYVNKAGLIPPNPTPAVPGVDPTPKQIPFESWGAFLQPYNDAVDVDMPTSITAVADLLYRSIQQLGLNAAQTINRVARDEIFKAYLSGQTLSIAATATTDTFIRVAALNGFIDVITPGTTVRPRPVSPSTPLPIKIGIGSSLINANVIGQVPDNPLDPWGPGTLILSAQIGSVVPARTVVRSIYAPDVIRAGGADSIDGIGANDILTLQQILNASAQLRAASILPHEDGYYHAHIGSLSNVQVYADPVWQRLNTALPDGVNYKKGFLGIMGGIMFFENEEDPRYETVVGKSVSYTGGSGSAIYTSELGAEVVNVNNVKIGRTIVTGRGALYERSLDESAFVTEAGTTGKIGEFDVVNQGVQILTEHIRFIMRAPIDRLQQKVSLAWSISTAFPVPSDILAPSGLQRFKRAMVLEHAIGTL